MHWEQMGNHHISGLYFPEFRRSISPYSVQMLENTDQKKLRIWTHFMQCILKNIFENIASIQMLITDSS